MWTIINKLQTGCAEMLTAAAIEERQAMKANPRIVKLMRTWWESAMALSKETTIASDSCGSDSDSDSTSEADEQMTKDQYVTLLVALQKMLDPSVALADSTEAAEKDWVIDMAHNPNEQMAFDRFF
jgi:hypothetical protein